MGSYYHIYLSQQEQDSSQNHSSRISVIPADSAAFPTSLLGFWESFDNEQELYQRYENSTGRFEQEDIINSTAQDLNAGLISAIQAQYGRGIQHTRGALTYEEESAALARPRPPKQLAGGNPLDVMRFGPEGMFTALFRPLPSDVSGTLGFLSGLEGLLLLYLLFRAIRRTSVQELKNPILIWAIATVLFWALIYGFAINNFGTGIRWRTQIMPFFLGLLLYFGRYRDKENIHVKPSKL